MLDDCKLMRLLAKVAQTSSLSVSAKIVAGRDDFREALERGSVSRSRLVDDGNAVC